MVAIPRAPGIDLIESQMVDTCSITRDTRGVFDDVLNEATGELEPPTSDYDSTIYSGKCLVAMITMGDKEMSVAEMAKEMNYYKLLAPNNASTGAVRIGDLVTMTSTAYDVPLNGEEMRIYKIEKTTHSVYRRFMVESTSDALGTSNPAV